MNKNLDEFVEIKKVIYYQCPCCGRKFTTEDSAIKCLNGHNVVFEIMAYTVSHDCWGATEVSYEPTGKIFKDYRDALRHKKEDDQIQIRKLN
jgi:hypothetical protein